MNKTKRVTMNRFLETKPKRKIPKLVNCAFLACLFGFGFDFGFTNSIGKKHRSFVQVLTTTVSISILVSLELSVILYVKEIQFEDVLTLLVVGHQMIHVIYLRFSNYNLYHFIIDVYKIDERVMLNKENMLVGVLIAYNAVMFIAVVSGCTFYCLNNNCHMYYIPNGIYCAVTFGLDQICIVKVIIYYYIYDSVKCLMHNMDKVFDSKSIKKQYTDIANCSDKIKDFYGTLVRQT